MPYKLNNAATLMRVLGLLTVASCMLSSNYSHAQPYGPAAVVVSAGGTLLIELRFPKDHEESVAVMENGTNTMLRGFNNAYKGDNIERCRQSDEAPNCNWKWKNDSNADKNFVLRASYRTAYNKNEPPYLPWAPMTIFEFIEYANDKCKFQWSWHGAPVTDPLTVTVTTRDAAGKCNR